MPDNHRLIWDDWDKNKAYWQHATPAQVKRAIESGADVHARDEDGNTALYHMKDNEALRGLYRQNSTLLQRAWWWFRGTYLSL